jgi:hypothetical protein
MSRNLFVIETRDNKQLIATMGCPVIASTSINIKKEEAMVTITEFWSNARAKYIQNVLERRYLSGTIVSMRSARVLIPAASAEAANAPSTPCRPRSPL